MEDNRKVTRLLLVNVYFLAVVTVLAGIVGRSWMPVLAFVAVVGGSLAVSALWAAVLVPVFTMVRGVATRTRAMRRDEASERASDDTSARGGPRANGAAVLPPREP